uniref:50S ribosomal protein L40e n=2 Tax=environmental samples TaxID=651140 RepID=A0A075FT21_9ARCH|nr:ribosomal protein L40e (RP-L40e, RPL40) [uncultured marine thaumarchaeote AD1000_46_C12]AIE94541.1 ribosomal protein L40e (RP-L40e, RPL40) [uncultured marine thaumarchaeote AD1000_46_F05]
MLKQKFYASIRPIKKQIAQKARLHMKICISCGARLDMKSTRCRKCRSTTLRLKNRQLGIKK